MTEPLKTTNQTQRPEIEMEVVRSREGWLSRLGSDLFRPIAIRRAPTVEIQQTLEPVAETGGSPPWTIITFIVMVIIPSIICAFYFISVASDQYTAEARFTVRSLSDNDNEEGVSGGAARLMSMSAANQDSYVVTSFINSAEILKRLDGKVDYRAIFESPEADFWSRHDPDNSLEDFLSYWSDHVTAYIDGPSKIITLTVRTFKPENSVILAAAILKESEQLINEMTVRARQDLLKSYKEEVDKATLQYQGALADLNKLQNKVGFLNPDQEVVQTATLLTGLLAQAMEIDSRIFVLRQSNGTESPSYKQLLISRDGLAQQIRDLRESLAGRNDSALANIITEYSAVETNRLVAEKLFEVAQQNYNKAFAETLRKALYLTVFVEPSLPEEASYPKRYTSPLLLSLGFLVFWSLLRLLWASVEDHRL